MHPAADEIDADQEHTFGSPGEVLGALGLLGELGSGGKVLFEVEEVLGPVFPAGIGIIEVVPLVVAGNDQDGDLRRLENVRDLGVLRFRPGFLGAADNIAQVDKELALVVSADQRDVALEERLLLGLVRPSAGGGEDEWLATDRAEDCKQQGKCDKFLDHSLVTSFGIVDETSHKQTQR